MSIWSVVFQKEVVDGIRDRRALSSAMLFPLLGPVMISVMLSVISSEKELQGGIELPISGEEYAPNLVQFLTENGVVLEEAPEEEIKEEEMDEEFTAKEP